MWAERGISDDEAKLLGLEQLGALELSRRLQEHIPAGVTGIALPYHELDGSPLRKMGGDPYVRYRLHGPFAEEMGKYTQAKGSGLAAYVPQLKLDWQTIAASSYVSLWLTEGEFKSIRVCQRSGPCIGIRGAGNWQTQGGRLARPLDSIAWSGRKVYIVFDADEGCGLTQTHKPQVARSISKLTNKLLENGAKPNCLHIARTTTYKGGKMGIDDFDDRGGDYDELMRTATQM